MTNFNQDEHHRKDIGVSRKTQIGFSSSILQCTGTTQNCHTADLPIITAYDVEKKLEKM